MKPFDLHEPSSLRDAIALLDADDPTTRPIAGGTALMLMMKAGIFQPGRLVSLRRIAPDYSGIAETSTGEISLGGMATLTALARSSLVRQELPVVADCLPALSNVRVRNVATLGGHLAHADPHTDLPPVLIALGAHVVAAGPDGARTIPVEDLASGYYSTVLAGNELITDVRVPRQGARRGAYLKWTARSADDWPTVGVAIVLNVDDDHIADARVVVSAATDRPTRLTTAEDALRGQRVTDALLQRAGEAARAQVDAVEDSRGSADYKKELVRISIVRGVRRCLDGGHR
jgi:carbon-monoxide dehydrogenase medium subunit